MGKNDVFVWCAVASYTLLYLSCTIMYQVVGSGLWANDRSEMIPVAGHSRLISGCVDRY